MKTNWQTKKLGEICKISTGKSNANEAIEHGKYAFFDRSKTIKKSSRFIFDCEALIIPGEGAEFFPRYYSGKFDLHQRAYALFNFKSDIMIRFIEYFLIFNHKYFERVAVGATAKSLRFRHFYDLEIFFPPISEQQRIIKILDKVFEETDRVKKNTEINLQNAKDLSESYLHNLFMNPSYKVKTLGELCKDVEYGSSLKSKSVGKIPVLRMGNIQDGRFNWNKLVYSDDDHENKKYLLKYNDVLFNRTNSPELVGKTAIYKGEMPAIFAGYLIRIRGNEVLDPDYLNYFLNSNIAKDYGKKVVISSVNQANINGTKLKSYPIPSPSLSEQKSIVKKLDELSEKTKKLKEIYKQKLADLEELKKSILKKAFAGEL